MAVSTALRRLLVDSPESLGGRARARRWELVRSTFPDLADLHVVDLGGTVDAWLQAPVRPRHVTVLNLFEPGPADHDWITPVTGDACDAEAALEAAVGRSRYDLVFSNAVIEHVGGHAQRLRFAASVTALAERHWVQTPYRYFPVEPHWLFPGMQFLPVAARSRVALRWPLGHTPPSSLEEARSAVQWTDLIGISEMRGYFPSSRIVTERVAGLVKSLIAVRSA